MIISYGERSELNIINEVSSIVFGCSILSRYSITMLACFLISSFKELIYYLKGYILIFYHEHLQLLTYINQHWIYDVDLCWLLILSLPHLLLHLHALLNLHISHLILILFNFVQHVLQFVIMLIKLIAHILKFVCFLLTFLLLLVQHILQNFNLVELLLLVMYDGNLWNLGLIMLKHLGWC